MEFLQSSKSRAGTGAQPLQNQIIGVGAIPPWLPPVVAPWLPGVTWMEFLQSSKSRAGTGAQPLQNQIIGVGAIPPWLPRGCPREINVAFCKRILTHLQIKNDTSKEF